MLSSSARTALLIQSALITRSPLLATSSMGRASVWYHLDFEFGGALLQDFKGARRPGQKSRARRNASHVAFVGGT